jgi:hypothetical protein
MIPHEKALVKRLENEPFALIGINTDPDKAEYKKQIASNGITWRSAWDGSTRGPLCTKWGVSSFPTIYVLDAKGTIRHIGLRGEDLEQAVNALIREAKAGGPDSGSQEAKPPSKGSQEGTKEKSKEEGEKLDPEAPGAPELPGSDPRATKSSNRALSIS